MKTVYLILKKSQCNNLSIFNKLLYILSGGSKEDVIIGFTTNKLVAKAYVNIYHQDNFYIQEINMKEDSYNIFLTANNLYELKHFRLKNGYTILTKKEKMIYDKNGV